MVDRYSKFASEHLAVAALGTLIGIIPGSFVFVNLGQTLGRIDSLSDSFWLRRSRGSCCSVRWRWRRWSSGKCARRELRKRDSARRWSEHQGGTK